MKLLLYLSDFIVPVTILGIVAYGVFNKVNVYDDFIKGAKSGFFTVIKIMPTLIGLMVAVGILRASGFLDFLSEIIGKMTAYVGFPSQLVPLAIVRMFSSSAATGLVLDIFKEYGTDSRIGLIASIMMSCTETIFLHDERYILWRRKCERPDIHLPGHLLQRWLGLWQVYGWQLIEDMEELMVYRNH